MTARAKPKRTIRVQQRHRKRTAPLPETWATRARHSNWLFGIEMAAIAAALVGIFLTAFAFRTQLEINKEEALAREQEAIARSWELVTRRASGNSGKVGALEYLASQGQVLNGIDLSCATMGGIDVVKGTETCARPTFLNELDLSEHTHGKPVLLFNADLSGAVLSEADLSGARLSRADLSGVSLWKADLSSAWLPRADLSDAWLTEANLRGAHLRGGDLSGADLRGGNLIGAVLWEADLSGADLRWADLSGADLNGAIFTGAKRIASADFTDAWAWADDPPTDLPISIDLCVHQPDWFRDTRPDPCVPPDPGE